jgi:hypothetical protein
VSEKIAMSLRCVVIRENNSREYGEYFEDSHLADLVSSMNILSGNEKWLRANDVAAVGVENEQGRFVYYLDTTGVVKPVKVRYN